MTGGCSEEEEEEEVACNFPVVVRSALMALKNLMTPFHGDEDRQYVLCPKIVLMISE